MRPALIPSRRVAAALLVGLAALTSPASACAAFVKADGNTVSIADGKHAYSGGTFTGLVEVDQQGPNNASVRITLTNTATTGSGLHLDSVAFNTPTGMSITGVKLATTGGISPNWTPNGGPPQPGDFVNDISTGPFGNFDVGAGIGGSWHTSGVLTDGLKPGNTTGSTGTFIFDLTGTGLGGLTAELLLAAMSQDTDGVSSTSNSSSGLAIRYRSNNSHYSNGDKVLTKTTKVNYPPYTPPGAVPAPPAVILALAGVSCLLGRGAFRRKAKPTV